MQYFQPLFAKMWLPSYVPWGCGAPKSPPVWVFVAVFDPKRPPADETAPAGAPKALGA